MTAAAEDAGASAGGVSVLVADVQRQVTELEAAASTHADASVSGSDDEQGVPADEEGVERIADYFDERARREQVRL